MVVKKCFFCGYREVVLWLWKGSCVAVENEVVVIGYYVISFF